MTTATRTARRPRWALAFLAAVLAIAVGLFAAGPTSALTASAARTRVGASTSAAGVLVGPSTGITAGQRLGNDPPQPQIVVATGVAAETATAAEEAGAAEACAGGLCGIPGKTCFVAGTLIRTERGDIPIEDVQVGDKVWSRNIDTGEDELQPVVETYVRRANVLLTLTVADGALTTTVDHPFMVQGRGWVKAGGLRIGDVLVTPTGVTPLTGVGLVSMSATVYNFQVAVNHDYYAIAGTTPILVHNANYWPTPTAGNCTQCAGAIQEIIGGERAVITPRGAPRLGPSTRDPGGTGSTMRWS